VLSPAGHQTRSRRKEDRILRVIFPENSFFW
jgi:hypothetical protein